MAIECTPLHYLVHYCKIVLSKLSKWHESGSTGLHTVVQYLDICVGHGHFLWRALFLWELVPFEKCKLNTLHMHGCVVDQKLSYLYLCSNACLVASKACMHVAHVLKI